MQRIGPVLLESVLKEIGPIQQEIAPDLVEINGPCSAQNRSHSGRNCPVLKRIYLILEEIATVLKDIAPVLEIIGPVRKEAARVLKIIGPVLKEIVPVLKKKTVSFLKKLLPF